MARWLQTHGSGRQERCTAAGRDAALAPAPQELECSRLPSGRGEGRGGEGGGGPRGSAGSPDTSALDAGVTTAHQLPLSSGVGGRPPAWGRRKSSVLRRLSRWPALQAVNPASVAEGLMSSSMVMGRIRKTHHTQTREPLPQSCEGDMPPGALAWNKRLPHQSPRPLTPPARLREAPHLSVHTCRAAPHRVRWPPPGGRRPGCPAACLPPLWTHH